MLKGKLGQFLILWKPRTFGLPLDTVSPTIMCYNTWEAIMRRIKLNSDKHLDCLWCQVTEKFRRQPPVVGTSSSILFRWRCWGLQEEKAYTRKRYETRRWKWAPKFVVLCFSSFQEAAHICARSGPLCPKEMSACALIQSPMPLLMIASTCCFNVTAGSPSIPHWLWLPSAAGSSPFHQLHSISSAISASPNYHMYLKSIFPPTIDLCYVSYSLPETFPSLLTFCSL